MVKIIFANPLNDFVSRFIEADHHGRGHNLSRLVFKTAGELIKFRVMEKTQPIEANGVMQLGRGSQPILNSCNS
jgi:hypothetical protein